MAQLTANFELGSNGSNILSSDPGSATAWDTTEALGGGILTYDNTHPAHGTLGAKIDAASGNRCDMIWSTAMGTVTDHYGRFYIYLTAYPASAGGLLSVYNGAGFCFRMQVNGSGQILGVDNTGVAFTFTNVISLNQQVRIEYHLVHSATVGQQEIKLFNTASSSTATETQTSAANRNLDAQADQLKFAVGDGGLSAWAYWMDDIVGNATSYPGPFVEPVVATQVLSMQSHVFGHGVW
jgi:hypothetical protein